MRIFQHFYARWWAGQLHTPHAGTSGTRAGSGPATTTGSTPQPAPAAPSTASATATARVADDSHSFLTEDDSWQTPYWSPASPKCHERQLYTSQIAGNT